MEKKKTHASVRKIRTALRTNQIVGFVAAPAWQKKTRLFNSETFGRPGVPAPLSLTSDKKNKFSRTHLSLVDVEVEVGSTIRIVVVIAVILNLN